MFSDRVVHATDMRESTANKDRISMDLRFFDPEHIADSSKKAPVAELRNFYKEHIPMPQVEMSITTTDKNVSDMSIAEIQKCAQQALINGDRNTCIELRNKTATKRLDQLRSEGQMCGLMMNAIPKSGSKFIRKVLMTTLNLSHKNVILGRFPDKIYNEKMLPDCSSSNCIMQGHASGNIYNQLQLNQHFDRLVIHVRDPRQSILSLVKYFEKYRENRPESLLLFALPNDFFNMPFSDRIDWG